MIGIYIIISPTKRIYIGQTWDWARRLREYVSLSKSIKKQRAIYNSLKKYGPKNHIFKLVSELPEDVSQEIMNRYEVLFIEAYKQAYGKSKVLNIREGGSNGKHSPVSRRRMSQARKGKWTQQQRNALKELWESNKGKQRSEEAVRLTAEKNRGKKRTDASRKKISERLKGKKHSDDLRRKQSERLKGKQISQAFMEGAKNRVYTDEYRKKLSEAGKHKPNEASRKKMSEAAKSKRSEKQKEQLLKVCSSNKGRKQTEEAKKQISETKKRKGYSEETRRMLSEAGKKGAKARRLKLYPDENQFTDTEQQRIS